MGKAKKGKEVEKKTFKRQFNDKVKRKPTGMRKNDWKALSRYL